MSEHSTLLERAKNSQKEHVVRSNELSKHLVASVGKVLDSDNHKVYNTGILIHQLNEQIDKQMKKIYDSFNELMRFKFNLFRLVCKLTERVKIHSVVETVQTRVESIDQRLRILENTLAFIKRNKGRDDSVL